MPVQHTNNDITNKNINYIVVTKNNQKTKNKDTLIDEAHTVEETLENLMETNLKANKIKLVGDKGYARKLEDKQQLYNKYNTELKYSHRRN